MPDKQTRHAPSKGAGKLTGSIRHGRARLGWRKLPSGRSVRICALWIVALVMVLAIGLLARMTVIGLNPDLGPEGTKIRNIANAANKHLSNNPNWSAWCFSDWGSFSSRESIGWIPCQQRSTQTSSRPKWCVR